MTWPRLPRLLVAAVALAVLSLGLAIWAVGLRQENGRLARQLRSARRGARPALPPPPGTNAPEALRKENERLRHDLEQATVPQVNVPTVGLAPGVPRPEAAVEAGSTALLVLSPPAGATPSEYRLRVLAHDGSLVWEGTGLKRGPDGAITVVWPGSLAQPGDYRLELFGPAQSDRRLATFHLTVRADEAAGG